MLVGVMSDSHDNMFNVEVAFKIFQDHGVDAVIHLGDIISPFIVKKIARLAWNDLMVYAVFGNNDGDKVLLNKLFSENNWSIAEGPRLFEFNGRRILALHGYNGIEYTKKIVYSIASSTKIDLILYGHTHERDYHIINNTIIVNPGETYGYLTGNPSIAIIDLEKLKVEFIDLE